MNNLPKWLQEIKARHAEMTRFDKKSGVRRPLRSHTDCILLLSVVELLIEEHEEVGDYFYHDKPGIPVFIKHVIARTALKAAQKTSEGK